MTTELHIRFDGDGESLKHHRLSIGELGDSLSLLLKALRRAASNLATGALESGDGAKGGRYTKDAERLDLELVAIRDGCVRLDMVCTQRPPLEGETLPLWDLREGAVKRLLEDLQAESRDESRNPQARRFLDSLPPAITVQEYAVLVDGQVVREAAIETVRSRPEAPRLPRMLQARGTVVAAGLESGRETITLKADKRITCDASPAQLERALASRGSIVQIVYLERVDSKRPRLLRIDEDGAAIGGTPEQRTEAIASRWDAVLAELAK